MQTDASVDIPEQYPAVAQLVAAGLYTTPATPRPPVGAFLHS